MGGGSKSQTVGYKYYLGMHMVLCHGPVDAVGQMRADDRIAWEGINSGGTSFISNEGLFGGESREGGVSGNVDVNMGTSSSANGYLQSKIGVNTPPFKGVVSAIFKQVYMGMNPYLKPWSFMTKRIHKTTGGATQWYDAKAEIPTTVLYAQVAQDPYTLINKGETWQYQYQLKGTTADYSAADYNHSGWPSSQAPFWYYSTSHPWIGISSWGAGFNTNTGNVNNQVWMRRNFTVTTETRLDFLQAHDDTPYVWVDGVPLTLTTVQQGSTSASVVVSAGQHNITYFVGQATTYYFADITVTATPLNVYMNPADMNPAHIIRECLTDPDWGMGYSTSDIDDSSFTAAADTLYDEGLGISLVWDRQKSIEDFVSTIISHIDAVLYVDRVTGLFCLKLIRDDFDEGTIPHYTSTEITKVESLSRSMISELVNSVTVIYDDIKTGQEGSVTVQDSAMIQLQGSVIGTTVQYPGFSNQTNASKVALRDLKSLSTPITKIKIKVDRTIDPPIPGDVFKMTWPDLGVDGVVFRVNNVYLGKLTDNSITIEATEDVYSFPDVAIVVDQDSLWSSLSDDPVAPSIQVTYEAPYYENIQVLGETSFQNALSTNPDIGYVVTAASTVNAAINATVWSDIAAAGGFTEYQKFDFAPHVYLKTDIGRLDTSVEYTFYDTTAIPDINGLDFTAASLQYMTRTPSVAGNRTTWTFSCWVRRSSIGTAQRIISADGSYDGYIKFQADDTLAFRVGSGTAYQIVTTESFTDTLDFYHIVAVADTTNTIETSRLRLYVNGSRISAFSSALYPPQNFITDFNNTVTHYLSRYPLSSLEYLDAVLSEVQMIDGLALEGSDLGEYSNGVWASSLYSGSYGTSGFYLDFSDTANIGADASGLSNDWTPVSMTSADITPDSPSRAFALSILGSVDNVEIGSYALIDNEFIRVDAIDEETGTITFGRAVLDTVPAIHTAGTPILFCDAFYGQDSIEYTAGETVSHKVVTLTTGGELSIFDANATSVTTNSRSYRPYRPASFAIEANLDPTFADQFTFPANLTWLHRNRLQETAGYLLDWEDGSITPEVGTTYDIVFTGYTGDGQLTGYTETITGLTGESYSYDTTNVLTNPTNSVIIKAEISSVRDSYSSYYAADISFRGPYDLVVQETGDVLQNEDGTFILLD